MLKTSNPYQFPIDRALHSLANITPPIQQMSIPHIFRQTSTPVAWDAQQQSSWIWSAASIISGPTLAVNNTFLMQVSPVCAVDMLRDEKETCDVTKRRVNTPMILLDVHKETFRIEIAQFLPYVLLSI
ncbi:hypothetical protein M378DRAFT_166824 [Amanita muscaria Koide BX008]|uniref:Uncharacterized protein n=1 Tax=Amanita muscaria (strain Koide BX008) TaxID=946122 RepID=A0A0C2WJ58_AMAMK|nr:hypothetical protein M378DRAFT_166824 [Amanita muscaria Koide BX008]